MWNCRLGAVPVVEVKIPQPSREGPAAASSAHLEGGLVSPEGEDREVMTGPRAASGVELGIASHKLSSAVGVQGHDVGGVAVQRDWERQSHRHYAIVAMAADVSCSRYDGVGSGGYEVLASGRCWGSGWGRRWWWGRRRCWDLPRGLDHNANWRACLKEAHRGIGRVEGWLASNRKLYNVPKRIALAFWFCANVSQFHVTESAAWVTVQGVLL